MVHLIAIDKTTRIGNDKKVLDREAAIAWYRRNRARSRALFDLLEPVVYYQRPIELRHPIVFYEGHLPAFSFNTLVKKALGGPSIDARLEAIFARGIDPHESEPAGSAGPRGPALHQTGGPAQTDVGRVLSNPPGPALRLRDAGRVLADPAAAWPTRDEVHAFAEEADRRVLDALCHADLERHGHPLLDRAEAVFTILEHEAMHHETLLYMWHRLPLENKRWPGDYVSRADLIRSAPLPSPQEWIEVPGGTVTLGVDRDAIRFGWDNEFPRHDVEVGAFSIERFSVTNAQFLEFVEAGGYGDPRWWRPEDWKWIQSERVMHPLFWEPVTGETEVLCHNSNGGEWFWRGMFERVPLPLAWPVYVSYAEAAAYARWLGARLMTEAEYQRAAFGVPSPAAALGSHGRLPREGPAPKAPFGSPDGEREHPWGNASPSPEHGVFDFSSWDPEPAGSHPKGRSAWGVDDLAGNGWEWTSTVFAPFPGFRAMASYPEYSADFFDGEHMVMKGASPATAAELLRPTFRNWFRPRYPYVYAKFRCVTERRRQ